VDDDQDVIQLWPEPAETEIEPDQPQAGLPSPQNFAQQRNSDEAPQLPLGWEFASGQDMIEQIASSPVQPNKPDGIGRDSNRTRASSPVQSDPPGGIDRGPEGAMSSSPVLDRRIGVRVRDNLFVIPMILRDANSLLDNALYKHNFDLELVKRDIMQEEGVFKNIHETMVVGEAVINNLYEPTNAEYMETKSKILGLIAVKLAAKFSEKYSGKWSKNFIKFFEENEEQFVGDMREVLSVSPRIYIVVIIYSSEEEQISSDEIRQIYQSTISHERFQLSIAVHQRWVDFYIVMNRVVEAFKDDGLFNDFYKLFRMRHKNLFTKGNIYNLTTEFWAVFYYNVLIIAYVSGITEDLNASFEELRERIVKELDDDLVRDVFEIFEGIKSDVEQEVEEDLRSIEALGLHHELGWQVGNAAGSPIQATTDDDVVPGGIDMNPNILNLQTQGGRFDLKIPLNFIDLQNIRIDGFTPVIINVAPLTNLPLLLGLVEETEESENVRITPGRDPMDHRMEYDEELVS